MYELLTFTENIQIIENNRQYRKLNENQNKKFESNIQPTRGDLLQLTELLNPYFNPKSFMEIIK
jgi:hypothetical protein